ncbi:hypothetical protein RvVAR031_pl00450 (plasmid) [Agrobacterium vitis]|uniref:hypothetical protein n=1 Tax=Agrobacterium vitis TaxID=373 RepID=UPI000872D253|nr:hypothetical protein [Agrobacterium vitis]BCH56714.1 hypothetical protein RvVAR031_pl00450 [Agrobacterium vitis]
MRYQAFGSVCYNSCLVETLISVEIMRQAQAKFGNRPGRSQTLQPLIGRNSAAFAKESAIILDEVGTN